MDSSHVWKRRRSQALVREGASEQEKPKRDDLPREKLRDLLIAAFGATLLAAQHIDPKVKIELT